MNEIIAAHHGRYSRSSVITCTGILLAISLSGCQRPTHTEVHGKVSVKNEPVASGLISFLPRNGDGPSAEAVITDGSYTVPVAPGAKIVRIEGFRVVGEQHAFPGVPDSPMVPVRVPIPIAIDPAHPLTADIVLQKEQTLDFEF